jgi:hypothetical protein
MAVEMSHTSKNSFPNDQYMSLNDVGYSLLSESGYRNKGYKDTYHYYKNPASTLFKTF